MYVCFGSQAALRANISSMSASGCKAAVQNGKNRVKSGAAFGQ